MEISLYNSYLFSAILLLVLYLYWYFTRNFNYWSKKGINGPKPVIGFGTILDQLFKLRCQLTVDWFKQYGKIYGAFYGNKPYLVVAEPQLIQTILVKDFHIFSDRNIRQELHPILDKHMFASTGDDWRRIRSIISPTFTSGKMKKMYPMIRESLNNLIDELDVYANNGQNVNMRTQFGDYTMDVIANCAFATKTNAYKDPNNKFRLNGQKVLSTFLIKLLPMMLFPNYLLKLLNIRHQSDESANQFFFALTRRIIKERKSSNNNKYNDFIQLVLNAEKNSRDNKEDIVDENNTNEAHYVNEGMEENAINKKVFNISNKYLTEDEIIAQAWIFFLAGYETTATTLSFCIYELTMNPEIQEKLYEEVMDSVDSNGEIDYDLLGKLPHLDAVISETLRLHPPVISLRRVANEDYKLGDTGIHIFKGQRIEMPVYAIHHSEEFYEKPNQFIAERFLPENRHKIIPYTYLPFGTGPRHCIGMRFALMEAKLGLAHIIKRFRFVRSADTDIPVQLKHNPSVHTPQRVIVGIQKR